MPTRLMLPPQRRFPVMGELEVDAVAVGPGWIRQVSGDKSVHQCGGPESHLHGR